MLAVRWPVAFPPSPKPPRKPNLQQLAPLVPCSSRCYARKRVPAMYRAVYKGHLTGIFNNMEESRKYVEGFPDAIHKSFNDKKLAARWLQECKEFEVKMENIRLRELYPSSEESQPSDDDSRIQTEGGPSSSFTKDEPLNRVIAVNSTGRSTSNYRYQKESADMVASLSPEAGGNGAGALRGITELASKDSPNSEYQFPSPPSPPLSSEQEHVLNLVLQGYSVFFSGPAGSGKSLIVQHIKYYLDKRGVSYAITAPTGVAAVLLGGQTIYSWSGVGKGEKGVNFYLPHAKRDAIKRVSSGNVWRDTKVLLIDEISMLSPDLFEKLDKIARVSRFPHCGQDEVPPFGGMQLVVCGDFFQLPPVDIECQKNCFKCGEPVIPVTEREYLHENHYRISNEISHLDHIHGVGIDPTRWTVCTRKYHNDIYCGHLWNDTRKYCFQTQTWSQIKFRSALLSRVFRQSDQDWIDKLSKIKAGQISNEILYYLNCLRRPLRTLEGFMKPTRLYTHRKDVEQENQEEFNKLPSQMYEFTAIDKGNMTSKNQFMTRNLSERELELHHFFRHLPVPKALQLKYGAQVMLLANIDIKSELVNGSSGIVAGFASCDRHQFLEIARQQNYIADSRAQKAMISGYYDAFNIGGKVRVPLVRFTEMKSQHLRPIMPVIPVSWSTQISQWYTPLEKNTLRLERTQIPLGLAWATTIHKSQGKTMDYVAVDVSGAFEPGQAYVGLSRCRTPEGIQILGRSKDLARAFSVDPSVVKFQRFTEWKVQQGLKNDDRMNMVTVKS